MCFIITFFLKNLLNLVYSSEIEVVPFLHSLQLNYQQHPSWALSMATSLPSPISPSWQYFTPFCEVKATIIFQLSWNESSLCSVFKVVF